MPMRTTRKDRPPARAGNASRVLRILHIGLRLATGMAQRLHNLSGLNGIKMQIAYAIRLEGSEDCELLRLATCSAGAVE